MIDAATGLLPQFAVELPTPNLAPWQSGNTGVLGFWSFTADRPGPHVGITSLTHGNELAGAIALETMLRNGVKLACGTLTLGFNNLDAFARFDRTQPTASRFVDEDLNRLWDTGALDGARRSRELDRARAMRPLIDQMDVLLDLHSMLWPSDPLILSGPTAKGCKLSQLIASPGLVVADSGHAAGRRMIDYAPFTGPGEATAILVEAGQHWEAATVACTRACIDRLLHVTGLVPNPNAPCEPVRTACVTMTVTANTSAFAFVRPFHGGEVIAQRNTLIALDGTAEIRTPHDNCMLVMPSLRPSRGHTAVRLARFV